MAVPVRKIHLQASRSNKTELSNRKTLPDTLYIPSVCTIQLHTVQQVLTPSSRRLSRSMRTGTYGQYWHARVRVTISAGLAVRLRLALETLARSDCIVFYPFASRCSSVYIIPRSLSRSQASCTPAVQLTLAIRRLTADQFVVIEHAVNQR